LISINLCAFAGQVRVNSGYNIAMNVRRAQKVNSQCWYFY